MRGRAGARRARRIIGSRLRITRSGGSLRTNISDRGRCGDRLVAAERCDAGYHGGDRIAAKPHDEKADGRVPEADHRPGQGESEEQKEKASRGAEPAGRQRVAGERQKAAMVSSDEGCKQRPASEQFAVGIGTWRLNPWCAVDRSRA